MEIHSYGRHGPLRRIFRYRHYNLDVVGNVVKEVNPKILHHTIPYTHYKIEPTENDLINHNPSGVKWFRIYHRKLRCEGFRPPKRQGECLVH